MHTVIKGTKSIAEFEEVKKKMEQLATELFEIHKKSFEIWKEGEIEKVWFDTDNILCIEYTSGNWWHYRIVSVDPLCIEWW